MLIRPRCLLSQASTLGRSKAGVRFATLGALCQVLSTGSLCNDGSCRRKAQGIRYFGSGSHACKGISERSIAIHFFPAAEERAQRSRVGVHPNQQRRGHGHALLRPIMARASAEGVPICLETAQPNVRAFYEKLGFKSAIESVHPVTGLRFWTYQRDP